MELWREKLESINQNDLISNISGASSSVKIYDHLFCNNFTATDAEAFFDIFNAFNKYYSTQTAERDLRQLNKNLELQLSVTQIPPLEVILYASRAINKYINNNERIFNMLTTVLQSYIKDSYQSIECMAGSWEWNTQLLLLAEACGRANDDKAISIMMNNYYRICNLFGQSDKVQKAYIRMLIHTQNEKYMKYMVDIVTSNTFYNNPECMNLLKRPILSKESFVSEFKEDFFEEIKSRNIPREFKAKLERILGITNNEVSAESFVWQWGTKSKASLFKFSQINNRDELPDIIEKIVNDFDQITGKENMQMALYTLGIKANYSQDPIAIGKVCDLCYQILEDNDILSVGAYIGLYEMGKGNISKAFDDAFERDNYYSGIVALGNYLRFRKTIVNDEFISFIEDKFISCNWQKESLENYIDRLKVVVEKFNSNKKALSNTKKFNGRIIDLLNLTLTKHIYGSSVYNYCLDIMVMIQDASYEHTNVVLNVLEKLKNDNNIPAYVIKRINGLIKKMQPPTLPQ